MPKNHKVLKPHKMCVSASRESTDENIYILYEPGNETFNLIKTSMELFQSWTLSVRTRLEVKKIFALNLKFVKQELGN